MANAGTEIQLLARSNLGLRMKLRPKRRLQKDEKYVKHCPSDCCVKRLPLSAMLSIRANEAEYS